MKFLNVLKNTNRHYSLLANTRYFVLLNYQQTITIWTGHCIMLVEMTESTFVQKYLQGMGRYISV